MFAGWVRALLGRSAALALLRLARAPCSGSLPVCRSFVFEMSAQVTLSTLSSRPAIALASRRCMRLSHLVLLNLVRLVCAQNSDAQCLDASRNGICLGMVPDEGDAGGVAHTIADVNAAIAPRRWSVIGWYAQTKPGTPFDGSQIVGLIPDLVASRATFEAAVMPTGACFVDSLQLIDQAASQASPRPTRRKPSTSAPSCASAALSTPSERARKRFTDAGIPTRLRFAHECNWYVTDGTYTGTLACVNVDLRVADRRSDCKSSFTIVARTCRKLAPAVLMFLVRLPCEPH